MTLKFKVIANTCIALLAIKELIEFTGSFEAAPDDTDDNIQSHYNSFTRSFIIIIDQ